METTTTWTLVPETQTWRKIGPSGQIMLVRQYLSGWDATIRYVSGEEVRGPRYYATKSAARNWADRYVGA